MDALAEMPEAQKTDFCNISTNQRPEKLSEIKGKVFGFL